MQTTLRHIPGCLRDASRCAFWVSPCCLQRNMWEGMPKMYLIKTHSTGFELMAHYVFCREVELSMFGCVNSEERPGERCRKRGCKSRHIHLATWRSQKERLALWVYPPNRPVPANTASSYKTLVLRDAKQPTSYPLAAGRPLVFAAIEGRPATPSYRPWGRPTRVSTWCSEIELTGALGNE